MIQRLLKGVLEYEEDADVRLARRGDDGAEMIEEMRLFG
jgi:hypothetical protein